MEYDKLLMTHPAVYRKIYYQCYNSGDQTTNGAITNTMQYYHQKQRNRSLIITNIDHPDKSTFLKKSKSAKMEYLQI